jgi:hypothetical protein
MIKNAKVSDHIGGSHLGILRAIAEESQFRFRKSAAYQPKRGNGANRIAQVPGSIDENALLSVG